MTKSEMVDIPTILLSQAMPSTPHARAAALLGGTDTGAYTGLTLGDLIYDRMSIDPRALEAFELAHKPVAGDIHRLAVWARGTLEGSHTTVEGRINRLQGYVFERMAAAALRQGGQVVEMPDSAINPGWDLRVNGIEAQVKCGLSPHLVAEHFARHPDVRRVIVNEELASHVVGDDRVMAIGGITRDLVRGQTNTSMHAAADMLSLNMAQFAPTLSMIRNSWALWRQDTDWQSAAGNVAVEGAARYAGVMAGKALGLTIAAGLGGWPAVLAPVFVSAAGYRGGRAVANLVKRHVMLRAEAAAIDHATRAWCAGCPRVLSIMMDQAAKAGMRFQATRDRAGPAWSPLMDDWLNRLEAEQDYRCLHQKRFQQAVSNLSILDDGGGPLGLAGNVTLAASRAGLMPADLPSERKKLVASAEAYSGGLRRRLLS